MERRTGRFLQGVSPAGGSRVTCHAPPFPFNDLFAKRFGGYLCHTQTDHPLLDVATAAVVKGVQLSRAVRDVRPRGHGAFL